MKKGLLLSVVASTMIFAGGDIAPVEPAAPAAADFWGQVGFAFQAEDLDNSAPRRDLSWGDEQNNRFSAILVLGVEKELGNGFGFGAEVAGWTDFGFDFADRSAQFWADGLLNGASDVTGAEISQAYLTYTAGNTAVKAGRQALPKAVSPWAWSARSAGIIDLSYDGIVIANTDLADTTLVGAWVYNVVDGAIGNVGQGFKNAGIPTELADTTHISDGAGVFMLAMINKSLANTTLALSGYYVPDNVVDRNNAVNAYRGNTARDNWSIWGSAVGSFDAINWGLQLAYVDGDYTNTDSTFGIAGKVGSKWGDFNAELVVAYINDGDYSFRTAGSTLGTSAFWSFNGDNGGDAVANEEQWSIMVKAGYDLHEYGKIFGNIAYWEYDEDVAAGWLLDNQFDIRLGYKFTVSGINSKIEYRYLDTERAGVGSNDPTRQRIRVEAYYKF